MNIGNIFRFYCSNKINFTHKIIKHMKFFQGSFELFLSLENVLHIGGQVIVSFNSGVPSGKLPVLKALDINYIYL
jgi:hypothetical protein